MIRLIYLHWCNLGRGGEREGHVGLELSSILHAVLNRAPQTSRPPKAGRLACQIKSLSLNLALKLEHFLPLNMHIHGEGSSAARARLYGCSLVKTDLRAILSERVGTSLHFKVSEAGKKVSQNHLRICGPSPCPPAVAYDGM